MRCKKRYTDLTSISGVCSCCLRERLLSLIAAQQQSQSQSQIQNADGKHRISDHNPPFPRSVSPYINNRRRNHSEGAIACSDNNLQNDHRYPHPHHRHSISDQLFYKTPQVQRATFIDGYADNINTGFESNKKQSFVRFLSFSNIFRSRNRKSVDSVSDLPFVDNNNNATSSPSWFSSIVHGNLHRRKQSQSQSVDVNESTVSVRRHICRRDRGMSPVRNSDVDESNNVDEHEYVESVYESTDSWKNTPRRTPAAQYHNAGVFGGGKGHRRNLSGLTFCLSPLVRASPKRKWNQKVLPPEVLFSGEIRAPVKAHLANTKSFQANRSRKLADFGRRNHNR